MLRIQIVPEPWPHCYWDPELECGDPKTGALTGYKTDDREGAEKARSGWHVADMCNCPSCPLRVAIRDARDNQGRTVESSRP